MSRIKHTQAALGDKNAVTSTARVGMVGVRAMSAFSVAVVPFAFAAVTAVPAHADTVMANLASSTNVTASQVAAQSDGDEEEAALQAYADSGYSYADAKTLAERWDGSFSLTADEAKVKAGGFLADTGTLRDTPFADETADDNLDDGDLKALFYDDYRVADADILAEFWDISIADTETRAGSDIKVLGILPAIDPS